MSRDPNDAFPVPIENDGRGMSLREWYAGLAMQGLLASAQNIKAVPPLKPTEVAEGAFNIADAMIAESDRVK